MRQTTFTDLRNNAKDFFNAGDAGEIGRVFRDGKLIADVVPIAFWMSEDLERLSQSDPVRR